jgi:hypothetical protein
MLLLVFLFISICNVNGGLLAQKISQGKDLEEHNIFTERPNAAFSSVKDGLCNVQIDEKSQKANFDFLYQRVLEENQDVVEFKNLKTEIGQDIDNAQLDNARIKIETCKANFPNSSQLDKYISKLEISEEIADYNQSYQDIRTLFIEDNG